MNKSRTKKIPLKIKMQIVSESFAPGCVVSELASQYSVSKQSIYYWRKEFDANHNKYPTSPAHNHFVELPIIDAKPHILEKASLVFRDFSLVLEGQIQTSSLLSILKILEESC
jgi:transposase-like protein